MKIQCQNEKGLFGEGRLFIRIPFTVSSLLIKESRKILSNWMMNRTESSTTPVKYTHVNRDITVGVEAVTVAVAISLFVFVSLVIKSV